MTKRGASHCGFNLIRQTRFENIVTLGWDYYTGVEDGVFLRSENIVEGKSKEKNKLYWWDLKNKKLIKYRSSEFVFKSL